MRHMHYFWPRSFIFPSSESNHHLGKLRGNLSSIKRKSWMSLTSKTNKWTLIPERFSGSYDVSKMTASLIRVCSASRSAVSYVWKILSSSRRTPSNFSSANSTECNLEGPRRKKKWKFPDLNLIYLIKPQLKPISKLQKNNIFKHSKTTVFSAVDNLSKEKTKQDDQFEKAFVELMSASTYHPWSVLSQKRQEETRGPSNGDKDLSSRTIPADFSATSQFKLKQSEAITHWRIHDLKDLIYLSRPQWMTAFVLKRDKSLKPSKAIFSSIDDFVKQQNGEFEKAFSEMMTTSHRSQEQASSSQNQKGAKIGKLGSKTTNQIISQASLESRSKFLVKSLVTAVSRESQLIRLKEMCKHLHVFPQEKSTLIKEGAHRVVLQLRECSQESAIWAQTREALALLGYIDPPLGYGVRILSIDGGGTRGLMAIEILRQLETRTGKKIHELFDFVCGVSTGAILTLLICGLRMPLDECEVLYKQLSQEIFSQSPWWGTGRLVWSHAYYDTNVWVNKLKGSFNEKLLTESARYHNNPKFAVVSTVMNQPTLQAYVFRNYNLPYRVQSPYLGSCSHKMWEAVRASGAAPGYFEEFCLDDIVHQDGGLMINNPTSLAIHEAKMLWPKEAIQCVVSIGSGRYIPPPQTIHTSTSLKTKLLKVIDSATDTEAVHISLNDLLPPSKYFRLNPYLTELLTLDEHRPEKLQQLKIDAQMYLRRNEHKLSHAVTSLSKHRGYFQRTKDWIQLKKKIKW